MLCGFENDLARDLRDRVAVGVAALADPTPHKVLVQTLGRLAGCEAPHVALADPVTATVGCVDLVGENDLPGPVKTELVFGVDQDQAALLGERASVREQRERQVGDGRPIARASANLGR